MKQSTLPKKTKKTIVYDGLCTMCKGLTGAISQSDKNQQFHAIDYTSERLPSSVSREAAEKEIHVITADGTVYRNAAAVLAILEEYPRLAWLARIGRLPGIRTILAWLYQLVAARRQFLWGDIGRLFWLKLVIVSGFIAGIVLSLPLWLSERAMPTVPFIAAWPNVAAPFDLIGLLAVIGLLLAVAIKKQPRLYIWVFVVSLIFICLGDQMRWQPWVYQYTALLAALGFCAWRKDDLAGNAQILNVCRLILVTTYLWSGIHKLNVGFIFSTAPWMLQPITDSMPAVIDPYIISAGAVLPIFEMAIGVGLFWPKTRKLAIVGAIAMHIGILMLLGPLGQNWNAVVWPWNIAMIASVLLLFRRTPHVSALAILWNKRFAYHGIILILFGVLPALSLFGKWDAYLSSTLYSSDVIRASMRINAPQEAIPESIVGAGVTSQRATTTIHFGSWSYGVLHTPPYPETRVFKQLGAVVCAAIDHPHDAQLRLTFQETPFRKGFAKTYTCANLR